MNFKGRHRLRLTSRNEGKIKSFDSCVDIRAWSHDIRVRDSYLRDWIKCDMPVCVLPVCALASILTVMTCRNRNVPRRHMSCKSKIILDSVCSSCNIMKGCLNNNKEFEKYFIEEELETIHWPCEKCLEVLKNIKVFWKIVIEKVLKIKLPKSEKEFETVKSSLRNVAKEWRKEIVEEAKFVKSSTVLFRKKKLSEQESPSINGSISHGEDSPITYQFHNKMTETELGVRSIASQKDDKCIRRNISKCTSVNIKTGTRLIDACDKKYDEELIFYKNNVENLRRQFSLQRRELDRLEKENISLNFELQSIQEKKLHSPFSHGKSLTKVDNTVALAPFEVNSEENFSSDPAKDIDSEMIISLKNCRDENFKNVSMLQVLHKTNEKNFNLTENCSYYKKEDPVHILNKVHKTFGAIVRREISIAKETKSSKNKDVIIKTTFRNVGASTPTYSMSSSSITSETNFESAKELYDSSLRSDTQ